MTRTAKPPLGASPPGQAWHAVDRQAAYRRVKRLQMRIAKAVREGRWGKVSALQWLLTHSQSAKILAVLRVTRNTGRNTPGVDGVVWKTAAEKYIAVRSLQRRGYQPQPLRRIYIPKQNGKQRPLSIPTMSCRAMQALHLQALEPVAETLADPNSYGFRPRRSVADAIQQCYIVLCKKHSAQWILEGDIKSCFDQISHQWLQDHIVMDTLILRKWLAAGYMEKGVVYSTEAGTPQGGITSPTLANMTLDGLEAAVHKAAPYKQKVNFIRYADDFIITGASKELLETKVRPAVIRFLKERGLELSPEKTRITHIDDGFDFLGFNVRKYKGKLLTKPAKKGVKNFLGDIRKLIKSQRTATTANLIRQLNPRLRGWAIQKRFVVAKRLFSRMDHQVYRALRAWIERRHPSKPAYWKWQRYFRRAGARSGVFFAKVRDASGKSIYQDLYALVSTPIIRHVKIRAHATPYDPAYTDYFAQRAKRWKSMSRKGSGLSQYQHHHSE